SRVSSRKPPLQTPVTSAVTSICSTQSCRAHPDPSAGSETRMTRIRAFISSLLPTRASCSDAYYSSLWPGHNLTPGRRGRDDERPMSREIKIYDTTLRDGTQGEGVTFSMEDKVRIAQRLDALGIHYIEGGWPGSNPKDLRFFKRVQDAV